MARLARYRFPADSISGWLVALGLGLLAPALVLLFASKAPSVPIIAVGMMAAGMISAAVRRRFSTGLGFGVLSGALLVALAAFTHARSLSDMIWIGAAIFVASVSFAARGALFARSASDKGWWIGLAVVAGEGALLATAAASPGAIPDWLLVLLPAQWAAIALGHGFDGGNIRAGIAALCALGGTAGATMIVARLWPSRWPYLVMFSTWIGLSALVWHTLD